MKLDTKENDSVALPLLLLLAMLSLGAVTSKIQLQSSRPSLQTSDGRVPTGQDGVEARLWQDPLAAVARAGDDVSQEPSFARVTRPDDLLIIPILANGGRYAEDGERRRRGRYATLTALLSLGYAPDDADRLGHWNIDRGTAQDGICVSAGTQSPLGAHTATAVSAGPRQHDISIAYEWFSRTPAQGDKKAAIGHVLLLWLNEDQLSAGKGRTLENLLLICNQTVVLERARFLNCKTFERSPIAIIGPSSSDVLVELRTKAPGGVTSQSFSVLAGPCARPAFDQFLSPLATIEEANIRSALGGDSARLVRASVPAGQFPPPITRAIATDADLAAALVQELLLRKVLTATAKDRAALMHSHPGAILSTAPRRIILFTEADTSYGRWLPESFKSALAHIPTGCTSAGASNAVQTYTYLRGIDGVAVPSPSIRLAPNAQSEAAKDNAERRDRPSENPTGDAQYDYLRRLVESVGRDTGAGSREGPVGAIGIFATDPYDKLLLLQAIRSTFPGVVVFTTDLDSRLLAPDQFRWTRNLLIASAFDLQLGRRLQGSVAPFRDGYQTAQFLATRCAVDGTCPGALIKLASANDLESEPFRFPVRVFEVGRTRPYDLSARPSLQDAPLFAATEDRPDAAMVLNRWALGLAAASLFGLLVFGSVNTNIGRSSRAAYLSAPNSYSRRELPGGSKLHLGALCARVADLFARLHDSVARAFTPLGEWTLWARNWLGLCLLGSLLWIAIGLITSFRPPSEGGEPVAVFEGLSAWPTEFLRALAIGLSISYCLNLMSRWDRNKWEVAEKYGLPSPRDTTPRLAIMNWRPEHEEAVDAAVLWSEYCSRGRRCVRLVRALLLTVLYFVTCWLLFTGLRMPDRPLRGAFMFRFDMILILVSIFMCSLLTFLVWDATRLCARFTLGLAHHRRTHYSASSLHTVQWLDKETASSWLDISIIADITAVVGQAIYYPTITLFVILAARNPVFANWRLGLPLILAISINVLVALLAAWNLRCAAERARGVELGRLNKRLDALIGMRAGCGTATVGNGRGSGPRIRTCIHQVRRAIEFVQNNKSGAFSPWTSHPFFRSILIPLGGTAAIWLAQYLATLLA